MLATATVCSVKRTTTERSDAGRQIAARRAYLGISQEDVEQRTNGLLYQTLLSRVERGAKSVSSLKVTEYTALLDVLKWTPEEFTKATGVTVPLPEIPNSHEYSPSLPVPMYASVSAGLQPGGIEDETVELFATDPSLVKGRDQNRLRWLPVNGTSMVSEDVRKSIPPGSRVLVELGAAPQPDDVVVAWLEDKQIAVLKKFQEDGDTILSSYNPRGPVFRASEVNMDIRAVVRWVFRKP